MNLLDLAALADKEVSDIQIVSNLRAAGIYTIDIVSSGPFEEQNAGEVDDEGNSTARFSLPIKGTILDFRPLNADHSKINPETGMESAIGRPYNEFLSVSADPEKAPRGLSEIKKRFAGAGFNTSKGVVLGGVEGKEGLIESAVAQRVVISVTHYKGGDGTPRADTRWLGYKAVKKLGIDWDGAIGRPAWDEKGNFIKETEHLIS
jgi:hypothetical protein